MAWSWYAAPVSLRMPQASTTSGTVSMNASAIPDRAWVTPAPGTTVRTPVCSVVLEIPSARKAAASSEVTSTGRTDERASASYSSVL